MANKPVPMMPMAKIANANGPAIGFKASAAWLEVWISVVPAAWRVAGRWCKNDCKGDEVGECHPDVSVDFNALPWHPVLVPATLPAAFSPLRF